jgi:hypothetical protein
MQAALQGLPYFESFNDAETPMQVKLHEAVQGKGQAWQVFTMTLPDFLPGGKGFKAAIPGGWRVATGSGTQVIAGDLYTGNTVARQYPYALPEGAPRLACIRAGDEISKLLSAMQQLTQPPLLTDLPSLLFNLHVLLLPGLVTEALWLQPWNPGAGSSYVVPFHTLIKTLETGKAYTEERFLQILQPVARKWDNFRKQEASRTSNNPNTGKTVTVPLLFPR